MANTVLTTDQLFEQDLRLWIYNFSFSFGPLTPSFPVPSDKAIVSAKGARLKLTKGTSDLYTFPKGNLDFEFLTNHCLTLNSTAAALCCNGTNIQGILQNFTNFLTEQPQPANPGPAFLSRFATIVLNAFHRFFSCKQAELFDQFCQHTILAVNKNRSNHSTILDKHPLVRFLRYSPQQMDALMRWEENAIESHEKPFQHLVSHVLGADALGIFISYVLYSTGNSSRDADEHLAACLGLPFAIHFSYSRTSAVQLMRCYLESLGQYLALPPPLNTLRYSVIPLDLNVLTDQSLLHETRTRWVGEVVVPYCLQVRDEALREAKAIAEMSDGNPKAEEVSTSVSDNLLDFVRREEQRLREQNLECFEVPIEIFKVALQNLPFVYIPTTTGERKKTKLAPVKPPKQPLKGKVNKKNVKKGRKQTKGIGRKKMAKKASNKDTKKSIQKHKKVKKSARPRKYHGSTSDSSDSDSDQTAMHNTQSSQNSLIASIIAKKGPTRSDRKTSA